MKTTIPNRMKYVIEHLDSRLYAWSLMEYTHISRIVGKQNLIFTNVKGKKAHEKLSRLGAVAKESVVGMGLSGACILDPKAEKTLGPKGKAFKFLIFGGVLGDHPPRGRTGEALTRNMDCPTRNLGPMQMSTDTAVLAASMLLEGRQPEYVDRPEIELREDEAVELPYRYVAERGKPVLPEGFVQFLRRRRDF